MFGKLLWCGLTLIVAIPPFLKIFGIQGADILVLVGAVAMVAGAILLVLDK